MQLIIMRETTGNNSRGDVIEVRSTSTPFSVGRFFLMVEAADVTLADWEKYSGAWERILDFETLVYNGALDGFRLRLFSETANAGQGLITKDEVESFINEWGGTVVSFDSNEVVFDATIFAALTSQAFFEIDTTNVVFTEISYDQGTGVHRIEADYSALGNNPTYVEKYLMSAGMTIVSHENRVITYEATRGIAKNAFEDDIKERAQKIIDKRRYYVNEGVVAAIEATITTEIIEGDTVETGGGFLETTAAIALTYLKDKAVD